MGAHGNGEARIFASPLARRMAQHAGLDLTGYRGSGPQGRIVKADIDRALAQPGAAEAQHLPAAAQETQQPAASLPTTGMAPMFAKEQVVALAGNPPYSEKPHTAMRRVIARRLSELKQTVPHFYMSVDCAIDELLKIRSTLEREVAQPDFSQRFRGPGRGLGIASGAGGQRVMERRGDLAMGPGRHFGRGGAR